VSITVAAVAQVVVAVVALLALVGLVAVVLVQVQVSAQQQEQQTQVVAVAVTVATGTAMSALTVAQALSSFDTQTVSHLQQQLQGHRHKPLQAAITFTLTPVAERSHSDGILRTNS
jgi:Na+/melibiose symporter-like transporter